MMEKGRSLVRCVASESDGWLRYVRQVTDVEDEFDLRGYVEVLIRGWKRIVSAGMVARLAALIGTFLNGTGRTRLQPRWLHKESRYEIQQGEL